MIEGQNRFRLRQPPGVRQVAAERTRPVEQCSGGDRRIELVVTPHLAGRDRRMTNHGLRSRGSQAGGAQHLEEALDRLPVEARATRSDLSPTSSPATSAGFCVATPVGQLLVLHRSAWMQPNANIMARAALHMSAPSASFVAIWNPVLTLPEAMMRMWSRRPAPTSALWTNDRPSLSGVPDRVGELERRGAGAALGAVDGDEVGERCRSRASPCRSPRNSWRLPTHSLKPTGLPPEGSRSWLHELQQPERRGEGGVRRRRDHVLAAARRRGSRRSPA